MPTKPRTSPEHGLFPTRMIHLALPVRWSLVGQEGRGAVEPACTYDIYPNGARLLSAREPNVGDLVVVERGRNKAICQVIWAADSHTPLRGQFAVQCVDNKMPWEEELRQMEEQYSPLAVAETRLRAFAHSDANRRRRPRFFVEGQAEVMDGVQRVVGKVQEMSEYGARIAAAESLRPGTEFRLTLNVLDVNLSLKAQVKYMTGGLGMGVEFQEIRRGDRPLLNYILGKLRTRKVEAVRPAEDFCPVEVIEEPLDMATVV